MVALEILWRTAGRRLDKNTSFFAKRRRLAPVILLKVRFGL